MAYDTVPRIACSLVARHSTRAGLSLTFVGVLDRQTYQGSIRGRRFCGENRDRETENSKVCVRTWDTRFIQFWVAKEASPTSCLAYQVWRPALGVGLVKMPARYPALLYIVQGAGS
jgi:hypothetical protein